MVRSKALRELVLNQLQQEGILPKGWGEHLPPASMLSEALSYRAHVLKQNERNYGKTNSPQQKAERKSLIEFMERQAALLHRGYLTTGQDITARQESYRKILSAYIAWLKKEPVPEFFPNTTREQNAAQFALLFRLLDDPYQPETPELPPARPASGRHRLLALQG